MTDEKSNYSHYFMDTFWSRWGDIVVAHQGNVNYWEESVGAINVDQMYAAFVHRMKEEGLIK